jgi:hypothetical protein
MNIKLFMSISIATIIIAACAPIPATGGNTSPDVISGPLLMTADQVLGDNTVLVPEVRSVGPGWVVVHSVVAGTPGTVIGYSHVGDGLTTDLRVNIKLSEATNTLIIVLHQDKGIVGKFEYPGPDEPVMVNNRLVSEAFVIDTSFLTSEFY